LLEATPPGCRSWTRTDDIVARWKDVQDDPVADAYFKRVWLGIPAPEALMAQDFPAFPDGIKMAPVLNPQGVCAIGLSREGDAGFAAGTLMDGGKQWMLGKADTVEQMEAFLREACGRGTMIKPVTIQLERDAWLPAANRWAVDRDLNPKGTRMLEHKRREMPEILARWLEAKPQMWLGANILSVVMSARAVNLPDGRATIIDAHPVIVALAVSWDAAQTAIRKDLKVKSNVVKAYG
jgi:hypothetical protein